MHSRCSQNSQRSHSLSFLIVIIFLPRIERSRVFLRLFTAFSCKFPYTALAIELEASAQKYRARLNSRSHSSRCCCCCCCCCYSFSFCFIFLLLFNCWFSSLHFISHWQMKQKLFLLHQMTVRIRYNEHIHSVKNFLKNCYGLADEYLNVITVFYFILEYFIFWSF